MFPIGRRYAGLHIIATIFLDRVIDRSRAPIAQIDTIMKGNRKIGLGIMGLAQYLIRQGLPYKLGRRFSGCIRGHKRDRCAV